MCGLKARKSELSHRCLRTGWRGSRACRSWSMAWDGSPQAHFSNPTWRPETVGFRTSIYLAEVSAVCMFVTEDGNNLVSLGCGPGASVRQLTLLPHHTVLYCKASASRELSGSALWYFCLEQPRPSLQVSGMASGV